MSSRGNFSFSKIRLAPCRKVPFLTLEVASVVHVDIHLLLRNDPCKFIQPVQKRFEAVATIGATRENLPCHWLAEQDTKEYG